MNKDFELKCYWHIPSEPENKIAGILTYKVGESPQLELYGGFTKGYPQKNYESIFGIDSDGRKISLLNCRSWGKFKLGTTGFDLVKYTCQFILINIHQNNINEKKFNNCEVEFSHLSQWLPNEGKEQLQVKYNDDDTVKSVCYSFDNDDYIEYTTLLDNRIKLSFAIKQYAQGTSFNREFKFSKNSICKIENSSEFNTIYGFYKLSRLINHFLTLAALSESYINSLKIYDKIDEVWVEFYEYQESNETLQITTDFLFYYGDISFEFKKIMDKWFDFKEELYPIRKHLISSIKKRKYFDSLDFLTIVQALEAFHRRFITKSNKNNINLRTRLCELINLFASIKKIEIPQDSISIIVNTRNYYSHFFNEEKMTFSIPELYNITKELQKLLICCVLNLIGFNNDKISTLIERRH